MNLEAGILLESFFEFGQRTGVKLDIFPAFGADQIVAVLFGRLKTQDAVRKDFFFGKPGFGEPFEIPIDRGDSECRKSSFKLFVKCFRRKRLYGIFEQCEKGSALSGVF